MGFELLPIEEGDENKYDVITITSPSRCTPQKFVSEVSNNPYYYDPTDATTEDSEYPAFVNHAAQTLEEQSPNDIGDISISDPYQPLLKTQAYVTTAWHRVLHHEIDPKDLRPYLGWRPTQDVKKTLKKTTQLAMMVIRYPLRRRIKSRFSHLNLTKIDEVVSTDPLFANCKSVYHVYTVA